MPYTASIYGEAAAFDGLEWTHPDNIVQVALNSVSDIYLEIREPQYHPYPELVVFRGVVRIFGGTITQEPEQEPAVPGRIY